MLKISTPLIALFILLLLYSLPVFAQKTIYGHIEDSKSHEPLAAANVQIERTLQGTISNEDGNFIIQIDNLPSTLLITYIGYQSKKISINSMTSEQINIFLNPIILEMDAIVVVAEDPALAIMREVIRRKQKWQKRLSTYIADAYSRIIFENDSGIVSIAESLSETFWDRDKGPREVIKSKRQTSNLNEQQNMAFASVIPNFYADDVELIGFQVIGPTHPDALDYYDYKLIRERRLDDKIVYDIRVIPDSKLQPTFEGIIAVLDEEFAVLNVDLKLGKSIHFPAPIQELNLHYRQQFRSYADSFWLPVDYRVAGDIIIGFTGLQFPRIKYKRITALSNYKVNASLPDSLYKEEKILTVDSLSIQEDTLFMASKVLVPLTDKEDQAYDSLDSTMTLEKAFKPTGFLADYIEMTYGDAEDDTSSKKNIFSYLSPQLWYNRVDALHAGLTFELDVLKNTQFRIGAAYKSGLKKWGYGTEIEYNAGSSYRWHGLLKYEVGTDSRYQSETYSLTMASILPLFAWQDYFDYYWRDGLSFEIGCKIASLKTDITIGFIAEKHRSLSKSSDFNIVWSDFIQRENPDINSGMMRSLCMRIQYGDDYIPFGVVGQKRISISVETSKPSLIASDFSYTKYGLSADWRINTFLTRRLLPNALDINISAGYSTGDLPLQRFGIIDGNFGIFTPFASIKSRRQRPYEGENHFALYWEHNFRTVPFELINFDFAVENGISIIIYGSHGRTWISDERLSQLSFKPAYTDHFHHELGISLNGILSLLRIDTSYRFNTGGIYVGTSLARFF